MTAALHSDIPQTPLTAPAKGLRRLSLRLDNIVLAGQRLLGVCLVAAAFGMWMAPGANGAAELVLIKLLGSVAVGLAGLACLQGFAQLPAPQIELDTVRREVRVVERLRKTACVVETCRFRDLGRVEHSGDHLRLWTASGRMLADVTISDGDALRNLTSALGTAGKL